MKKTTYLTTTLPYVNAAPHIGFALELVQADVIARYRRLESKEVFLNTGTDEHGAKIYQGALEAKKDPQAFVDENAKHFMGLLGVLNVDLQSGRFIRTSDPDHIAAAQEFWRRCDTAGDIYKAKYRVKYCVGCELEKTESELKGGKCPIHLNFTVEEREEENYFFKFSKYQKALLELYDRYPDFVVPAHRLTEIRNFVAAGLKDFSISRLKEKMPWGVPVPADETHVMYVWFDALVNYVSTLGWPSDEKKFEAFWGTKKTPKAVQFAGKDNLRQQSAMWQAMLLSTGLPTSRQIVIHGFITSGGEKMAKSRGNVVDPFEVVEKYGTDALRYWLTREMPTFEDGDFTWEKFKESYNAHLANGLGNLVARVMKLAEDHLEAPIVPPPPPTFSKEYKDALDAFEIKQAADVIWNNIQLLDQSINQREPFKLVKINEAEGKKLITELAEELYKIARMLNPFLPATSEKIKEAVRANKKPDALFPRVK
ncbi:MAG: methionine--tRNA ligase [Candidatus Jorgensenbacteria bacterium]|nr:methionine--tRNA ligase [Candidatus Jorgensenbacteria bacterium]